ncbi:MAG: DoxX family protein [Bacteroidota bacterium]
MDILFYLKFLLAAFFLYAGITHFRHPKFFYRITPPYLKKWEHPINIIVGVAEILGAIGLVIPNQQIQSAAAWGLIALLIAVFPANVYHLQSKGAGMKVPIWGLWLRLPLQFVLIAWTYAYT